MKIVLITKQGHRDTGVGRYVEQLAQALMALGHEVAFVYPVIPSPAWLNNILRRWLNWDLAAFFNNYPVWVRYPSADIYHVTSQNLACLLLFRAPPGKTVITVHDLIPWVTKHDQELRIYRHIFDALFDRLAQLGMRQSDGLVTDSDFTRKTLHELATRQKKNNGLDGIY